MAHAVRLVRAAGGAAGVAAGMAGVASEAAGGAVGGAAGSQAGAPPHLGGLSMTYCSERPPIFTDGSVGGSTAAASSPSKSSRCKSARAPAM